MHNLTQRKISAIRSIFEQLPDDPQNLTPEYVESTFVDMTPIARALLSLRLRPIEKALGRNLVLRTVKSNVVKTQDRPFYFEVLDAVITVLRATRATQNQTLLSHRNLRRIIAEYLGIELRKVNYHIPRFMANELAQRGIIELWDETQHAKTTARICKINTTVLDLD